MEFTTQDIQSFKELWFTFEEIQSIKESELDFEENWISFSHKEVIEMSRQKIFGNPNIYV